MLSLLFFYLELTAVLYILILYKTKTFHNAIFFSYLFFTIIIFSSLLNIGKTNISNTVINVLLQNIIFIKKFFMACNFTNEGKSQKKVYTFFWLFTFIRRDSNIYSDKHMILLVNIFIQT